MTTQVSMEERPGLEAAHGPNADGLNADDGNAARARTLKAVVVGLGILILLALAGVVAGFAYRASQLGKGAVISTERSASTETAAFPARDIALPLPAGSHVKSTSLSGQRLVVHHEGPVGAGIVVIDLASGQVLSRIEIVPEQRP